MKNVNLKKLGFFISIKIRLIFKLSWGCYFFLFVFFHSQLFAQDQIFKEPEVFQLFYVEKNLTNQADHKTSYIYNNQAFKEFLAACSSAIPDFFPIHPQQTRFFITPYDWREFWETPVDQRVILDRLKPETLEALEQYPIHFHLMIHCDIQQDNLPQNHIQKCYLLIYNHNVQKVIVKLEKEFARPMANIAPWAKKLIRLVHKDYIKWQQGYLWKSFKDNHEVIVDAPSIKDAKQNMINSVATVENEPVNSVKENFIGSNMFSDVKTLKTYLGFEKNPSYYPWWIKVEQGIRWFSQNWLHFFYKQSLSNGNNSKLVQKYQPKKMPPWASGIHIQSNFWTFINFVTNNRQNFQARGLGDLYFGFGASFLYHPHIYRKKNQKVHYHSFPLFFSAQWQKLFPWNQKSVGGAIGYERIHFWQNVYTYGRFPKHNFQFALIAEY